MTWDPEPSSESSGDNSDDDGDPHHERANRHDIMRQQYRRPRIVGPITTAYPPPTHWHFGTDAPDAKPRTLERLTSIKSITRHLTTALVGDTRPNCEANWNAHLTHPLSPRQWKMVWK